MSSNDFWRDAAQRAEARVSAACVAVGAIDYVLSEASGYSDAQRVELIAVQIARLNHALGFTTTTDAATSASTVRAPEGEN
jgi:hypothetical protein